MGEINSFADLEAAYRRLPWWRRFLVEIGVLRYPEFEAAERRLTLELYEAMDALCPLCGRSDDPKDDGDPNE